MNKTTLWAIDDESSITRMLKLVLERSLPVEVVPFHDAREALTRLDETDGAKPDLIICDLRMPHMDGFTFCRALKEKEHSIPVIILSAYVTSEMDEESQDLGIKSFVQKPFIPREFIEMIRGHIPA